ncbi:MAG: hypothetical protein JO283_04700 [Bradyrhizobium sp.]|nr:hypothetical protein [Bradyrhizobium sp.]
MAEIAKGEQVAKQPARRSGNDNHFRLRQALESSSDVRITADNCLRL